MSSEIRESDDTGILARYLLTQPVLYTRETVETQLLWTNSSLQLNIQHAHLHLSLLQYIVHTHFCYYGPLLVLKRLLLVHRRL
ncbi:hypothetical protein QE152_g40478 [Popillia japonica]|uniref:Uncharacterized protein n=1 Tax=Popillia japonica TaxID=7064 RepID=A0AAW1HGN0_POPJA